MLAFIILSIRVLNSTYHTLCACPMCSMCHIGVWQANWCAGYELWVGVVDRCDHLKSMIWSISDCFQESKRKRREFFTIFDFWNYSQLYLMPRSQNLAISVPTMMTTTGEQNRLPYPLHAYVQGNYSNMHGCAIPASPYWHKTVSSKPNHKHRCYTPWLGLERPMAHRTMFIASTCI